MLDVTNTHSLTEFLRNHKVHVKRLKKSKSPEILTINGTAEIVVQDAESYQELVARVYRMETIAAIHEGLASARRGELKDADQVLKDIKKKYDLPN